MFANCEFLHNLARKICRVLRFYVYICVCLFVVFLNHDLKYYFEQVVTIQPVQPEISNFNHLHHFTNIWNIFPLMPMVSSVSLSVHAWHSKLTPPPQNVHQQRAMGSAHTSLVPKKYAVCIFSELTHVLDLFVYII